MAFERIKRMYCREDGTVFYEFEDKGYQILFYQPANDIQSNLINYGFTGPSLLIFPDRKTDWEGLEKLCRETRLEEAAKANGVGVILVNPKEESFETEQPGAYEAVIANLGIAQANFRDGLAIMKNEAFPDEVKYAIMGSCVRMYAYGFGSGADYLARYYLKKVAGQTVMGDLGMADQSMTSVTLVNMSEVPQLEANDLHVASIGNSDEINEVLKKYCAEVCVRKDCDLYRDFYEFTGKYRRWAGRILTAYNYVSEGIIDKAESALVPISADNPVFERQVRFMRINKHKVGYVTFYDKDLDIVNEKHPLMLVFHGGGDTAYATASLAEWPEIGQQEGFITVAVEMHMNVSAKEVASLIEHLKQEYAIDEERIYATGFSMGGIKSWDLFEQCAGIFAAILPMDAADEVGHNCFGTWTENVNQDTLVPLLYVGGASSPLPELPCQHERALSCFQYVAKVNQLKQKFDYSYDDKDSWSDQYVVAKGDRVEVLKDEMYPNSDYIANYYDSEDGNCYTCILAITNHAHEIRKFTNRFAYDFVKKFSRGKDGKIRISK